MKRIGYTLAEALIAMAIVAIVTALMLPMASKFTPDVNKAMYLKTYDAIVNATHSITESAELSPVLNDPTKDPINYSTYPLFNTDAKSTFDGVTYGGDNSKYCKLLALALGGNPSGCSAQYSADPNWNAPSFTTKNGAAFYVYTNKQLSPNGTTATYQSDVYFDVDGVGKGNDCYFSSSTCTDPDRFKLMVGAGGDVHIADAKGMIHSKKRGNWRLNRDESGMPGFTADANLPAFKVDYIKDIFDEESKDEEPKGEEPGGDVDEGDGIGDLDGDFKDEADKGSEDDDQLGFDELPDCRPDKFGNLPEGCKDAELLDPTRGCKACIWIASLKKDPNYSHCFKDGVYNPNGYNTFYNGNTNTSLYVCSSGFIHTCGSSTK